MYLFPGMALLPKRSAEELDERLGVPLPFSLLVILSKWRREGETAFEVVERLLLREALDSAGGEQKAASRLLWSTPRSVCYLLRKHRANRKAGRE